MKKVTLKRLAVRNYRGQTITMDFTGDRTVIRGANGTGKSTLFNAFLWLNTLADSDDMANNDLFDSNLEFTPENAMTAEAEEIMDVDGMEYKFKRTAKPKWTRNSGSAEYTKASSDEYKYYIDDLAMSANQYRERIESMYGTPIDKLKLMLNVRHYQLLDWKTLRRHFGDMVGAIDKSELKGDYSKVEPMIAKYENDPTFKGNPVDAVKEELKQKIAPKEKAFKDIKSYIDGQKSTLPDLSGVADAKARAEEIKSKIAEVDKAIMGLGDANKPLVEKRNAELAEIDKLERDMASDRQSYTTIQAEPIHALEKQLADINADNAKIEAHNGAIDRDNANIERQIKTAEQQAEFLEEDLVRLRARKDEIKTRVFNDEMVCPTCGRPLPESEVASARDSFYAKRDKDLQEVCERGVRTSEQKQKQLDLIGSLKNQIESLPEKKQPLDPSDIKGQIAELKAAVIPFENTEQYKDYVAKIENLKANLTVIPEVDASELTAEKDRLQGEMQECYAIIANEKLHGDMMYIIKAKEEEQKILSIEIVRLEGLLNTCIARDREWASIVRDRANRYLTFCKVEMTDIDKSGKTTDICTVTVDGVDVKGTANNAKRIFAGIDIANAFQKNAGICLPLIIDNAEGVTDPFPETDNQMVFSYADKGYRQLTVM